MEVKRFEGFGRLLTVRFKCFRCGVTATRPLKDCLPLECNMRDLSDLRPPVDWRDGGFYYPTFCPDCAEKYDRFMKCEKVDGGAT